MTSSRSTGGRTNCIRLTTSEFADEHIAFSLHQLDSQSHQKLQQLKTQDRDGGEVVEWLRNNKDKFRMEIFEPAVLCMTVPNRAYADAVEACFGGSQLKVRVSGISAV